MKKNILSFLFLVFFVQFIYSQDDDYTVICDNGIQLEPMDDLNIGCEDEGCVTLVANISGGQTTNMLPINDYYITNELPPCLPDAPAENAVPLPIDDQWSTTSISLGFDFTFYGNTYNELVVSTNGALSFDVDLAGTYSGWSFDEITCVDNPEIPANSILNPFHDIDPSVGGTIKYETVGEAPYRKFYVEYTDVPMFSCNELLASTQIVLYETSNIIAINILKKPICESWNDGLAVAALLNKSHTVAHVAPGRDVGVWEVTEDNPEYWFFIPTIIEPVLVDGSAGTFTWRDGTGAILGDDPNGLEVCPTESSTYLAELEYEGNYYSEFVHVNVEPTPTATQPEGIMSCATVMGGDTAEFDLDTQSATIIGDQTDVTVAYYTSMEDAEAGTGAITSPYTNVSPTQTIYASVSNASGCNTITSFEISVFQIVSGSLSFAECSETVGSNEAAFELTDYNEEILGGQEATVTYYETEEDAEAGTGALTDTYYEGPSKDFFVRLENEMGCFDVGTVSLTIHAKPIVNAVSTVTACNEGYGLAIFDLTTAIEEALGDQEDVTVNLFKTQEDAEADINEIDPVDVELNGQTIYIKASNEHCETYGDFTVEIENCPPVVPNAFTPNGDGINDIYTIHKLKNIYEDYNLKIFNRWGALVYEGTNADAFWDGSVDGVISTDPSGATYFYILELNDGVHDPLKGTIFVNP